MKIFFPPIGTKIKLTADWKFRLFEERRNFKLFDALGYKNHGVASGYYADYKLPYETDMVGPDPKYHRGTPYDFVILPIDTVLRIDRIYIRNGASDFDSISFYAEIPKIKSKPRFWAKLVDINNNMEGDIIS